jgi:hypothetical protein
VYCAVGERGGSPRTFPLSKFTLNKLLAVTTHNFTTRLTIQAIHLPSGGCPVALSLSIVWWKSIACDGNHNFRLLKGEEVSNPRSEKNIVIINLITNNIQINQSW